MPAISLLFIPKMLDIKDIGNSTVPSNVSNWSIMRNNEIGNIYISTYKDDSDNCKHEERNVLFLVVFALLHGLPCLHHSDLLLFQ